MKKQKVIEIKCEKKNFWKDKKCKTMLSAAGRKIEWIPFVELWVNIQFYPMSLRYMRWLLSHNINKWLYKQAFLLTILLIKVHMNAYRRLPRCLLRQHYNVLADLRMLRLVRKQSVVWTLNASLTTCQMHWKSSFQSSPRPGVLHTQPILHPATSMIMADCECSGTTWTLDSALYFAHA